MRPYLLLSFLIGCSASTSGGSTDSGTVGTPDVTHPKDVTSGVDVQVNRDVISISFSDTSMPPPDATGDAPSKSDVVTSMEGGPHADGSSSDAGKDGESADAQAHAHDSGANDSGAKDTGTKDTSTTCTPVTVPTSTEGLTMCTPVTGMCGPGNTSSFTPNAAPPTPPDTTVCKAGQLTAIYNGCLAGSGSDTACTAAAQANMDCYNCVFTDSTTAATWGPVVSGSNQLANLNYGGCLQLLEPCNAPCAQAIVDNLECQLAACETNCSVAQGTQQEITAFGNCATAADNCLPPSCGMLGVETECIQSITGPDHPGSVCFADQSFDLPGFLTVAKLFCGGS